MTEERRQELIELGFPDDGYDYLKHLRVPGVGRAGLEVQAGRQPVEQAETFAGTFPGSCIRRMSTTPNSVSARNMSVGVL